MSMLYKLVRHNKIFLSELNNERCFLEELQGSKVDVTDAIPIMYQSGYLTIKNYNPESQIFTLKFPNYEVERGFLNGLLPAYTGISERNTMFAVEDFVADVNNGDVDKFLIRLQTFFADFPYENALRTERDFQNVMYCVMSLMGLRVNLERHSSLGSCDMIVSTSNYIYIFEFKVDKSPEKALEQIEDRGYGEPFKMDDRKLIKVGVEFSTETRNLKGWKIEA